MERQTIIDAREHVAYYGASMTGKTTLAREHAQKLSAGRYDVIVYDPVRTATINGDWPDDARIIGTPEEFFKQVDKLKGEDDRPLFLFVDEAADVFNHSNTDAKWIPRRIRHNGVYLRLIVQRPKMVSPDARGACSIGYVFRMSNEDTRMVLADYGHSIEAMEGHTLDRGDYVVLMSGSPEVVSGRNVFDSE